MIACRSFDVCLRCTHRGLFLGRHNIFQHFDCFLGCRPNGLIFVRPTSVEDLQQLVSVLRNLMFAMNANAVNRVDCDSFQKHHLRIHTFGDVYQVSHKLVVVVCKFSLNVKDQTDQTLKQLLLALVRLCLHVLKHFVCDEVKSAH